MHGQQISLLHARTNEVRVNTAGKRIFCYFYLGLIGFDFIDGLILELESKEFQHNFP